MSSKKKQDQYSAGLVSKPFWFYEYKAYVDELVRQGEFGDLRGLIYFTDGYGIFPGKMPAYKTAFVFLEEDYRDTDVPSWAIKLVLEEKGLE